MSTDQRGKYRQIDRAWEAVVEALFEIDPDGRPEAVKHIQGLAGELPDLTASWTRT